MLSREQHELSCYPFIYVAAAGDNCEGITMLKAKGADINAAIIPPLELAEGETLYCMPPLYFAALNLDASLSKLLLSCGADSQLKQELTHRITNKSKKNLAKSTIESMQEFIDKIK